MEEWKDIEGYKGLYQVSSYGRVKSLPKEWITANGGIQKHDGKILKLGMRRKGYHSIDLSKNGIRKAFSVHRLVALAFIPNPDNKPEVNHIDGNKLNNNVSNLEFCTSKENIQHAIDSSLRNTKGEKQHKAKLTEEQVRDIRASNLTQIELSKIYNIHNSSVSAIINRKSWKHI